MMKKNNYPCLLLFIWISLVSNTPIFACVCKIPEVCSAYSKSHKVFTGKVLESTEDKSSPFYTVNISFLVIETFKGETAKIETVKFKLGDCASFAFKVGETYFVYAEEGNVNTFCNRTVPLFKAQNELKYVQNLSKSNPFFLIKASLNFADNISKQEREKIKVFIVTKRKTVPIKFDKDGLFTFKAFQKEKYKVKIIIPFKSEIEVERDSEMLTDTVQMKRIGQTQLIYELNFKPHECDSREINISKE